MPVHSLTFHDASIIGSADFGRWYVRSVTYYMKEIRLHRKSQTEMNGKPAEYALSIAYSQRVW